MAVVPESVGRLATLVAFRLFPGMGAADSRSLRSYMSVRMQQFGRRSTVPFRRFWGMCGEKVGNVFLVLFMVLRVPIVVILCLRVVPKLWHASLFLGRKPLFQ
jgi:hypothetical protein